MFRPPRYALAALCAVFVVIAASAAPRSVTAQLAPGRYAAVGAAFYPGIGLEAAHVSAGTFFTREIVLIADLAPVNRRGSFQVAAVIGGSIRLLGISRTVAGAGYGALDLDIGLRIGPGLAFPLRENVVDRNTRFHLVLEPFLRASLPIARRAAFLELGVHRPAIRLGVWLPVGE